MMERTVTRLDRIFRMINFKWYMEYFRVRDTREIKE